MRIHQGISDGTKIILKVQLRMDKVNISFCQLILIP